MMTVKYNPLPSDQVTALRAGGPDAYGRTPERVRSDGKGNPCRHCLDYVPAGAEMLIVAHRPFNSLHPYAETGPIFLCADDCEAWADSDMPPILKPGADYLLRGYTADQRICYGTGKIVAQAELSDYAASLLENDEISFVDVRSSQYNCFQLRIVRDTKI